MAQKKMLLVEMDEKGIHTQVIGCIPDVMIMAKEALLAGRKAIAKCPLTSTGDSVNLMEEVIGDYLEEAHRISAQEVVIPVELLRMFIL